MVLDNIISCLVPCVADVDWSSVCEEGPETGTGESGATTISAAAHRMEQSIPPLCIYLDPSVD
jgi:hypothetical protein